MKRTVFAPRRVVILLAALAALATACGDDAALAVDAGEADAGPLPVDHCSYAPLPPTGGAGGMVTAGAVTAGAAEGFLDLPVGSALGCYTARAGFLGNTGRVDIRRVELSAKFNASVGVETRPRVKALALTAGDETVVILKADLGLAFDGVTHAVAERLGPEYAGKVIFATSHSHSAPGHFTGDSKLGVGLGRFRKQQFEAVVARLTDLAMQALAARRPARVGVHLEAGFDPMNLVTHDRRGENDVIAGGSFKDDRLWLVRVDGADGAPIAAVAVFGIHGTIMDADNPMQSTDAPGGIERGLEELFDEPVVVMHLQGAAGDVSPGGAGGLSCDNLPEGEPCYNFARAESVGRIAAPMLFAAWERAGEVLEDSLAMEMITRSVEVGPDPATFTVREGALSYAPFDWERVADGQIFDEAGAILSPIDEFNAPGGAGLCGEVGDAYFPAAEMPGSHGACPVEDHCPYRSCVRIEVAGPILGEIIGLDIEQAPICATTRTTISALRLGEHLLVTLPGEPLTVFADYVRSLAPDPERTIVVGYAQGHLGYLLTADDWLLGGYEPSINLWGPLEGEYIAERVAELMPLAMSDEREDTATDGASVFVAPDPDDSDMRPADPAPTRGTVVDALPEEVYARGGAPLAGSQPDALLPRLDSARYAWIGEDPLEGTPVITLQRRNVGGTFDDVTRRSGRVISDHDLLLTWTPIPLRRQDGAPRTHHWVVEWQAVSWWGSVESGLDARASVPLGVYRFHVVGTGYTLDSNEFEVRPATLQLAASLSGAALSVTVRYDATGGWRLLDLQAASNGVVPARSGPIEVVLLRADDSIAATLTAAAPDGEGRFAVDTAGVDLAGVTAVRVTDRFGNSGRAGL